jgi:hypothetical protein
VHALNASLFDRARAERFAQLMDEANGGRRHHARSRLDDELAELVAHAQLLRRMPLHADPDPIFRRDLRTMLIAAAERTFDEWDDELESASQFARPRARGAIVIGLAAGTLALSGVSVASGDAKPGDTLYGMKRSTERAQLAMAGSDLSRGQLYLDFARTRYQEASVIRGHRGDFLDALTEMDIETQRGAVMLLSTAVHKNDASALDAIDLFVKIQREDLDGLLATSKGEAREKILGSLYLLNAVEQRGVAARSALACGGTPSDSDALGPVLDGCALTGASRPAQTGPADTQDAAAGETAKKDDGLLAELGRILGGLLGG